MLDVLFDPLYRESCFGICGKVKEMMKRGLVVVGFMSSGIAREGWERWM